MAVRKDTITRQFNQTMQAGILEPGEQVITGMMTQTGASPWLAGLIGVILMLLTGTRWYYVMLTDRRVLFLKASLLTSKPTGAVAWADPRTAVSISDVVTDAKVWNRLRYHRPGQSEPVRLNVSAVQWKSEFQSLVSNLRAGNVPPVPGAPSIPPPPPVGPSP
jgi:heme/copper-type cytochrome/quinol oxidase subunit 2